MVLGNGDPRSQDERESDSGEVASPVSQDHLHPFNKGNEESEWRSSSLVQSFVPENKPLERVSGDVERSQKVGLKDDDDVKIERELSPMQDVESQDVTVEHVDSTKESHDGDDSSSSSSSSDNESQALEKKWKEEGYKSVLSAASRTNEEKAFSEEVAQTSKNEKPVREANSNSVAKTVPAVNLATPVVPISETVKRVSLGAEVENSEILDVVESGLAENEDKLLPTSAEVTVDLPVVAVPVKNEDKIFPILDENAGTSSNVVVSAVNGNESKTLTSSGTNAAEAGNDAGNTKDSQISECTENQVFSHSLFLIASLVYHSVSLCIFFGIDK